MLYLRPYWINNFSFELCELLLRIYQFFKSLVALPVIEICRRSSITAHLYVLFWWASYRSLPLAAIVVPELTSQPNLLSHFLFAGPTQISVTNSHFLYTTNCWFCNVPHINNTHTHTHTHTNVYSACWYPSCQLMMVMVAMWKRLLFYRATKWISNAGWFFSFIYLFFFY